MSLAQLMQKQDKLVIGLMSGTSADAVDAVLVQITGHGLDTVVRQRAYVTVPAAITAAPIPSVCYRAFWASCI
jgi:1,6-anhydro-N-acetylmuramate kinase